MKIRKNHAHMAITAQGAVNLRPLLLHYAKVLGEIEEDYREEIKENLSPNWHPYTHPVSILFANQISYLVLRGVSNSPGLNYVESYDACRKIVDNEKEE